MTTLDRDIFGVVRSKPTVIGILAGWFLFLGFISVLSMCSGCLPVDHRAAVPRNVYAQDASIVMIQMLCVESDPFDQTDGLGNPNPFPEQIDWGGSVGTGVIIDKNHVLTAAHVVRCPIIAEVRVSTQNGHHYHMVVQRSDESADLALLEMSSLDTFAHALPPAVFGPQPAVGDTVCTAVAWPRFEHHCGTISSVTDTAKNDTFMLLPVEHGNSGGGVYDMQGRVVGIVTTTILGLVAGQFTSVSRHLGDLHP